MSDNIYEPLFAEALQAAHLLGGGEASLPFLHDMMKDIDAILAPAEMLGGEVAKKQLFQAMFQRVATELSIDIGQLTRDYRDFVQSLVGSASTNAMTKWLAEQPLKGQAPTEAWKSGARYNMRQAMRRKLVEVGISHVVEVDDNLALKTVLDWG